MTSGCGYQFAASGTNLPATARTIYVKPFVNMTRITGLNDQFMRYMKDEIANHKRLELVDSPDHADLVLSGSIFAIDRTPQAFNSVLEPTIYTESMAVSASLMDKQDHKVIFSVRGLRNSQQFPVVSQAVVSTTPNFLQQNLRANDIAQMPDIQVARSQELVARGQMMAGLARHLYAAMASGF